MHKVLKIAHRGSVQDAPENSMKAFVSAVQAKVDMIELDVRVCKTGEVIVMHDATVDRTTNGKGKVKDMTFAELRKLHLEPKGNILTLAEVLDRLGNKVILNIEIKTLKTTQPVISLLHKYLRSKKLRYDDIILSSANPLTLRKIFLLDPRFRISVIVRYLPKLVARFTYRFKPFSVQPLDRITTEKFAKKLQEKNIKVFPWALTPHHDGNPFIQKMKQIGIDGIISFFPEKISDHEK